MDVRQLETFHAVATELSFTRAAARLLTAQSAVSATVRSLERELHADLFDRSARQIRLTPAGAALLPRARDVLDAVRGARDAVEAVQGGLTGTLAVGYMTSVTLVDIPAVLKTFTDRHPGVAVRLRAAERGTAGLVELLRDDRLDVAFAAVEAPGTPDLRAVELARSPLRPTVATSHPLAGRRRVTLGELAGETYVDFPAGFGNRVVVDALFAQAGLERRVALEVTDIAAGADLVRHGLGIAFLPDFLTDGQDGLHPLELAEGSPDLVVSVVTVRRRRLSAAGCALVELATAPGAAPAPPPAPGPGAARTGGPTDGP